MKLQLLIASLCAIGAALGGAPAASAAWVPTAQPSWYWQLDGALKMNQPADIYDVDGFDTSAATVSALHGAGKHVICYVSAGTYENWRSDARSFPAAVQGKAVDGWAG